MIHYTKILGMMDEQRKRAAEERLIQVIIEGLNQDEVRAAKRHAAYWRRRAMDAEERCERMVIEGGQYERA